MNIHIVGHGSQQTDLIHLRSQTGQVLANVDAGNCSRSRLKLTSDISGRMRLHVPQINLAGTTKEEQKHNRFGRRLGSLGRVQLGQPVRSKAEQTEATYSQQFPARQLAGIGTSKNRPHDSRTWYQEQKKKRVHWQSTIVSDCPAEKLVFNILLDLDQARSLKSEILNRIRTVVFLAIILEIT